MGNHRKSLKVPCVLMHRYMNDAIQYLKNSILSTESIFILDIFVPENVTKEVQAYMICSSLEKTIFVSMLCLKSYEKKRKADYSSAPLEWRNVITAIACLKHIL